MAQRWRETHLSLMYDLGEEYLVGSQKKTRSIIKYNGQSPLA